MGSIKFSLGDKVLVAGKVEGEVVGLQLVRGKHRYYVRLPDKFSFCKQWFNEEDLEWLTQPQSSS